MDIALQQGLGEVADDAPTAHLTEVRTAEAMGVGVGTVSPRPGTRSSGSAS